MTYQSFAPSKKTEIGLDLETLIVRIGQGNTGALAALYHETSAAIYGYALSFVKNKADAEDIMHDCFISIFESSANYKAKGKPMAWIFTISKNLCLMKLRERRRIEPMEEEAFAGIPAKVGTPTEDKIMIDMILSHLSAEDQQIVVLHAVGGYKHREIAAFLNLPLSTVLSKYRRALKKLSSVLDEEEITKGEGHEY